MTQRCIIFCQNKLLVLSTLVDGAGNNTENVLLPTMYDLQEASSSINFMTVTVEELVASISIEEFSVLSNIFDKINPRLQQETMKLNLIGLRQALNYFPQNIINRIIYFYQLNNYYSTHAYCGSCGDKTQKNKHNIFVSCNKCNHQVYPHIAPCIIVRIHRDDQILMARGVNFVPNAWGLIAGFVELNECLEEAVIREVKEEVGIEIHNIKYWGSQAWLFPGNSILVCFTADYKSGEINPDPTEISEAGFFNKLNIPGKPSTNYSITSKMIEEFINS